MSETGKGSEEDPTKGPTSKAVLRTKAFNSLRTEPMRARKTLEGEPEGSKDDGKGKTEAGNERDVVATGPRAAGPSRLATMAAYRDLQQAKARRRRLVANRWTPIGPSAVRKGLAVNRPVVSGRVSSLAVAPGGTRVYVGSANGGVWRSEDGGETWTPLMDAFDLNPQGYNADSLAVGALALVPGATAADDTLYVGTGEAINGGVDPTGGPMFGVGPVVSTDGGQNWRTELPAPGGPWTRLEGSGFYELAVDPTEPTRVLAATLNGLFLREPASAGGLFRWRHVRLPGLSVSAEVTSVVVAQAPGAGAVFYAVAKGGPVFRSVDGGETWSTVGSGLDTNLERLRLGVAAERPDVVYVFSSDFRLYRFDPIGDTWHLTRQLNPADSAVSSAQVFNINGLWNLSIAVAPDNPERVYLGAGASKVDANGYLSTNGTTFGAAIFRCDHSATINPATGAITGFRCQLHYIGAAAHPDVHALVFSPGDATQLWVGCDGGVFFSDNPPGEDGGLIASSPRPRIYFEAKNTGLQTLMMHHLGQHPTEDAVLFAGTQDNGCLRFTGEATWMQSKSGDCGWVLVNPDDPYSVVAGFQLERAIRRPLIERSLFGGNLRTFRRLDDRPSQVSQWTLFYYPVAGPPPGSSAPNLLAFGSVQVWISENFGQTWRMVPAEDPEEPQDNNLVGPVLSITFQSADRFFVGTHTIPGTFPEMGVYRFDRTGDTFTPTRLDRRGNTDLLPFHGSVTDIAIDWADSSGASIYATFGGFGAWGHVWHFDGTDWTRRDGGSPGQPGSLLDVSHNAIEVDPENPQTVYVGSDIGVWRSTDGGQRWEPFEEGMPDVAVTDLKLHPTRVLRAATHGRGVFERRIDEATVHHIELYIRDTTLDRGMRETVNGLDNPLQRLTQVRHWRGPDIKVDFPDAQGHLQFDLRREVDFATFTDGVVDDAEAVGHALGRGERHHVFAQIHNRGRATADRVRVMALITHATVGVPRLPSDYEERVQQGLAISNDDWETLGITTLDGVSARVPKIARFAIPHEVLPPSGILGGFGYSVLILVHHDQDEFPVTPWQQTSSGIQYRVLQPVGAMCRTRRLAAIKSVSQQPIRRELASVDATFPFNVVGSSYEGSSQEDASRKGSPFRFRFDLREFPGRVWIHLPKLAFTKDWLDRSKGFAVVEDAKERQRWADPELERLEALLEGKEPPHVGWTKQRMAAIQDIARNGMTLETHGGEERFLEGLVLEDDTSHTCFLRTALSKAEASEANAVRIDIDQLRPVELGDDEIVGGISVVLTGDSRE